MFINCKVNTDTYVKLLTQKNAYVEQRETNIKIRYFSVDNIVMWFVTRRYGSIRCF